MHTALDLVSWVKLLIDWEQTPVAWDEITTAPIKRHIVLENIDISQPVIKPVIYIYLYI